MFEICVATAAQKLGIEYGRHGSARVYNRGSEV